MKIEWQVSRQRTQVGLGKMSNESKAYIFSFITIIIITSNWKFLNRKQGQNQLSDFGLNVKVYYYHI